MESEEIRKKNPRNHEKNAQEKQDVETFVDVLWQSGETNRLQRDMLQINTFHADKLMKQPAGNANVFILRCFAFQSDAGLKPANWLASL